MSESHLDADFGELQPTQSSERMISALKSLKQKADNLVDCFDVFDMDVIQSLPGMDFQLPEPLRREHLVKTEAILVDLIAQVACRLVDTRECIAMAGVPDPFDRLWPYSFDDRAKGDFSAN